MLNLNLRRLQSWRDPFDPERLAAEENLHCAIGERSGHIAESWTWDEKAQILAETGQIWTLARAIGDAPVGTPKIVTMLAHWVEHAHDTYYDGELLEQCDRYYKQLGDSARAAFDEAMRRVDEAAIREAERELLAGYEQE